jgi:hypothetical protein
VFKFAAESHKLPPTSLFFFFFLFFLRFLSIHTDRWATLCYYDYILKIWSVYQIYHAVIWNINDFCAFCFGDMRIDVFLSAGLVLEIRGSIETSISYSDFSNCFRRILKALGWILCLFILWRESCQISWVWFRCA